MSMTGKHKEIALRIKHLMKEPFPSIAQAMSFFQQAIQMSWNPMWRNLLDRPLVPLTTVVADVLATKQAWRSIAHSQGSMWTALVAPFTATCDLVVADLTHASRTDFHLFI